MSTPVIQVENLSKYYRLGLIGGGTLREDVNRWIAKICGKPDPLLMVGEEDHGNREDGQIWALRDVNLEVNEGEILGIIGRNGAGKSTLLKILSKITAPTEGSIRIRGRVGSLLEVGTGFHPELTGRENIYLNGTILGMSHTEVSKKLEEIIEFAEMGQFIDTPVKRYSSGMRVRLAFAVAAHLEPEILIIDEVLAVGDMAFQKKCIGKMGEVGASGRTVLFVSHNLALVEHICNRAIYIDGGTLMMDDNVADVIKAYNASVTQKYDSSEAWYVDRDLLDRENGKSGIRVTNIDLLTSEYSKSAQITTADQIIIRLHFHAEERLKSPAFVVSFKTSSGLELFRLSTRPISGFDTGHVQGKGYVDLKIDSLLLTSGAYLIDVRVARENTEWIGRYDNVVKMRVSPKDVYQSGMALDNSKGYFVLPHEWSIRQEQPSREHKP